MAVCSFAGLLIAPRRTFVRDRDLGTAEFRDFIRDAILPRSNTQFHRMWFPFRQHDIAILCPFFHVDANKPLLQGRLLTSTEMFSIASVWILLEVEPISPPSLISCSPASSAYSSTTL